MLLLAVWPFGCVPSWEVKTAALANSGRSISGSVVAHVSPDLEKYAFTVNQCFNALCDVIGQLERADTHTNRQQVQAMVNALDRNVTQLILLQDSKAPDATVAAILQLLDQEVDEISALVPTAKAITFVLDPDRMKARGARAQRHNVRWFRSQYNSIIKNDRRFRPLP